VATTGRTALGEMRRLLDVLRTESGDDVGGLAPAPGLDGLDGLVAGARGAGLPVRLTVAGRSRPLSAGQDATAHRIVQESLTNVLKHAVEPSAVEVLVRWEDGGLVLQVSDDGRSAAASGQPGHGLTGMRERVEMYGGTLRARARPGGGFEVTARIPVAPQSPDAPGALTAGAAGD
jgi:signal transduction histidine kinase